VWQVSEYIKEVYNPGGCYISVKLDKDAIRALQLEINSASVMRAILNSPRTKIKAEVCTTRHDTQHATRHDTTRTHL
jgi:hypothetical protein